MSAKKTDTDAYNKPFAKRLRALMNNEHGISPLGRKLTQAELAEALSNAGFPTKRQTISLYINGTTAPDMEKFKAIADYFGVSYDYLLGASDSLNRENIDISAKTGLTDAAIQTLKNLQDEIKSDSYKGWVYREILAIVNGLLSDARVTALFSRTVWEYAQILNKQEKLDQMKTILRKSKNKEEAISKVSEAEYSPEVIKEVEANYEMLEFTLLKWEKEVKHNEWVSLEEIQSALKALISSVPEISTFNW
jgi:transcriptional regulator with XRE-family HTH domain